MKKIAIQAIAEVVICTEFLVLDEYEIKGSTPHEIYKELLQEFDDPDEPDITVGEINFNDYGVDSGQFIGFEQVTITNKDNPHQPIKVIEEPFSVLTKGEEVKRLLKYFVNDFDKEGFEVLHDVIFTDVEWDEFLDHMKEDGIDSLHSWINQFVENWRFSQRNSGNINQAA